MNNKCPICKSNEIFFQIKYNSNNSLFTNINIYTCKTCNSSFAYPMPSSNDLKKYYEKQDETSIGPDEAGLINKSFAYMLAKTRIKYIIQYTNFSKIYKPNILEIGPGYGHLAELIIQDYEINNYSVVEYDKNCFDKLNKIGTEVFEDIKNINKNNRYNLIIISHVLEHISDPISFLLNLKNNYLKENSYIFIDIPCEDWKYKAFVDPHLIFLNISSLTYISKLIDMNIIKIDYFGEKIHYINDNLDNFYLRQYKKVILLLNIILNIFQSNRGNYNLIQYTLKKIFKADLLSNEKSRWIRLILKN